MKNKSIKLNAVLNSIKQLCQVIFPLISIPYVSRVLGKVNYGKYNFSVSIVNYFSLIAALGIFNYAVVEGARLRENKNDLSRFENEVFSINVYSTIISYAILALLLIFATKLRNYRLLILVNAFSIIFTTIGTDWVNSIFEDYAYITIRYIIFQGLSIVLLFIFVKNENDYLNYAIINSMSTICSNIANIFYIRKKYGAIHFARNCELKKHLKPILYLFFNTLAVTIYVNSDTTILGLLKGDGDVGIYSISSKIYLVIKQVLNALVVVTLPRLSAYLGKGENEKYKELLKKIKIYLITLVVPVVIGVLFFSRQLISIVGGEGYISGTISLQILSFSLLFAVLANYYSTCILLPNRLEKICLYSSIISASLNVGLNFVVIPFFSYNGAAITTLVAEFTVYVIAKLHSQNLGDSPLSKRLFFSVIVGCGLEIIICYFSSTMIKNDILSILLGIIFSGIEYYFILLIFDNPVVIQINNLIKNKA